MIATEVSVSQKTLEMGMLRGKKKRLMREEVIKAYIRSHAGESITVDTLRYVAHFSSYPACYAFVKRMIRDGQLTKHHVLGRRGMVFEVVEESEPERVQPSDDTKVDRTVNKIMAEFKSQAMRWAWDNDSDSLRGFINSL